jgi:hypothetical protein
MLFSLTDHKPFGEDMTGHRSAPKRSVEHPAFAGVNPNDHVVRMMMLRVQDSQAAHSFPGQNNAAAAAGWDSEDFYVTHNRMLQVCARCFCAGRSSMRC